jgi:hypothetical protein
MNKITKKLQKLVETRKTSVVVSEQKDFKQYSKGNKRSTSLNDYCYYSSGSNYN